MTDDQIRQRLSAGEDSTCEFKEIKFSGVEPKDPKRDTLADEIAAFANADGGLLLCGVTDAGDLQGMSLEQMSRLQRTLVEICTDSIKPPVRPITQKRFLDGKGLVIAKIRRGDALYQSPGGYYVRAGDTKKKIGTEEQLSLNQRRSQARYSGYDRQYVPDTGFSTLEEDLWKPLLSPQGGLDPEAALLKLRLLAKDENKITRASVAGILLCTHEPHAWVPHATFSAASYSGLDQSQGQLDSAEITGPLDQQIREAMRFVRSNMRVAARKTPARIDMPEYSLNAAFEAVVNAVAHRDYSMSARRIRLAMFEDRLVLSSPGALPNGLTIDDMDTFQATRNEVIATVFTRMQAKGILGAENRRYIMEKRGDGVSIILRTTRELSGKSPGYDAPDGRELFLTIPAAKHKHNPHAATVRVLADGEPLQDAQLLVLYPNNSREEATTGHDGEACIDLYTSELPMKVYVAARGRKAHCEERWMPSQGTLEVDLRPYPRGGSVIFYGGDGRIPGLTGRLKPMCEPGESAYLYADNVTINRGKQQPVAFYFGEDLRLTDSYGSEALIRIVDVAGKSSLIEHRPFHSE